MSLRHRLLAIVLGTVFVTLVVTVGATFGALQDWAHDRDDRVLAEAGERLARELSPGGGLEPHEDSGVLWRSMAADGRVPSYFALFDRDGELVEELDYGRAPKGLDRPPSRTVDDGDGWLLHPVSLTDGRVLVVAMRTDATDELVDRTRNVAVICALAALASAALLCVFAVRRQLRPLETIAVTADAIRGGDLGRRIEATDPRDEVGRVSMALNAMLTAMEDSFAQRAQSQHRLRQFVADASHELRTPIASIRGYAELFRRGAASRPDDLAMAMTRIESEASRMSGLVEELLQLAELDEGSPLEAVGVDLEVLAAEALADAHARAPDRRLDLESAGGVVVCGDETRLRRLLANLLSNVLQHTPPEASGTVTLGRNQTHAVMTVRDTGPGLSAEQRERVFDRFYRADPARGRGGTGLGLAIVAAVVAAHHGRIEVYAPPDGGTGFCVELPLRGGTGPSG